jgi:hypothetical protein
MDTIYQKRSVGCAVSDPTYDEVLKVATRRGITVSELVRYYVEEGLSNPTPREMRRLNDRLSTMEGVIKELYEMAVVNWAQVKPKSLKVPKQPLPWEPGYFDAWKKQLTQKGLVNKKTGKSAYEDLKERSADWGEEGPPDSVTDEETEDLLRSMWKADRSWTEKEETEYQQKLKARREPKYTRPKKAVSKPQKTKAAGKTAPPAKKKAAKKKANRPQ